MSAAARGVDEGRMQMRPDASAQRQAGSTPALPSWIVEAHVRGYVTADRWLTGERRLFGSETLWGDWNGRVLVLAKDWGPSRLLRARIDAGEPQPWRHEPRMLTNRRLVRLGALAGIYAAEEGLDGVGVQRERECGALYGSALANLLREDGRVSGALPNRGAALEYGVEVLRFVRAHMPALEVVMCLGGEARESAEAAFGTTALELGDAAQEALATLASRVEHVATATRARRDSGAAAVASGAEFEAAIEASRLARTPLLIAARHPAARVTAASLQAPWRALARVLGSRMGSFRDPSSSAAA